MIKLFNSILYYMCEKNLFLDSRLRTLKGTSGNDDMVFL